MAGKNKPTMKKEKPLYFGKGKYVVVGKTKEDAKNIARKTDEKEVNIVMSRPQTISRNAFFQETDRLRPHGPSVTPKRPRLPRR